MNKIVLITGASRGIGEKTAELFAENGYTVIVNYFNNKEKAESLASRIGGMAVRADVSDIYQTSQMVDTVIEQYGKIDVLVNNAGISIVGLFDSLPAENVKRLFDVNIFGTFNCTKCVIPHMIKRKYGKIINVSSMWGQSGASCEVHYSASKAAVIGFTKALAKEVGPSGINVNCVSPGFIMTDMNKCFTYNEISEIVDEIPIGRYGEARDIAETILFLSSEKSGFITGQIIGVNGGMIV